MPLELSYMPSELSYMPSELSYMPSEHISSLFILLKFLHTEVLLFLPFFGSLRAGVKRKRAEVKCGIEIQIVSECKHCIPRPFAFEAVLVLRCCLRSRSQVKASGCASSCEAGTKVGRKDKRGLPKQSYGMRLALLSWRCIRV